MMNMYDREGVFDTRHRYAKNYYIHYIKLITCGHVMTFRDDISGILKGFCSWVLVHNGNMNDVNKVRWTIPDNIKDGNILYITSLLTTSSFMICKIRKAFRGMFKDKIERVLWYSVNNGRFAHFTIKGGHPCKTAA